MGPPRLRRRPSASPGTPASRRLRGILAVTLAATAIAATVPLGGGEADVALAAGACTKYAATTGSDTNPGTQSQPYRTAQKLVDNLSPGAVGCLAAGQTFAENVRFNQGGTPSAPVTLQSAPGGRATIIGQVYVPDESDDIVIENLILNGNDGPTITYRTNPSINGDRVVLLRNDISNDNTARICVHLGDKDYGEARDVRVMQNRIHNCGEISPTRSNLDHGVYVNWADGTVVADNFFYDNATYGVHLYPRALNTAVYRNVIDGNGKGVVFSGADGVASNNNQVYDNIITNPVVAPNIESWYPAGNPVGTGNVARNNCLLRAGGAATVGTQVGFTAFDNLVVDPQYANRAAKDFTVPVGNPCYFKQPRITQDENIRPTVAPFVLEAEPRDNEPVNFRSGAYDPDGTIMLVEWDLNNDGVWAEPSSSKVEWTFSAPGTYPIKVRATDDDGAVTTASMNLVVGAQVPETPPGMPTNQAPVSNFTWTLSAGQYGPFLQVVSTSTDSDGTIAERAWAFNSGTHPSDFYKFGTGHGGYVSPGWTNWMMVSHRTTDDDGARTYARKMIYVPPATPAPPPSSPPNLVANPSFESGVGDWGTWQGSLTRVELGPAAPSGTFVGKLTRTAGTAFTVDDTNPTVPSTAAGASYNASAQIAAATASSVGKNSRIFLRERNSAGSVLRTVSGPTLTLSGSFQEATASITPLSAGNKIEVYIDQSGAASGDAIYLDSISLTAG